VTPFGVTVVLLALLGASSILRRRWPTSEQWTKLLAYGAGMLQGLQLLERGRREASADEAWAILTVATVILLASARGIWRSVVRRNPRQSQNVHANAAELGR
jgi:hypothetical protein